MATRNQNQRVPTAVQRFGSSIAQSISRGAGGAGGGGQSDASRFLGIDPQQAQDPQKIKRDERQNVINGINGRNVMFMLRELENRVQIRQRSADPTEKTEQADINALQGVIAEEEPLPSTGSDEISQMLDEEVSGNLESATSDFIESGAPAPEKVPGVAGKAVASALVRKQPTVEEVKKQTEDLSIATKNSGKFGLTASDKAQANALAREVQFEDFVDEAASGAVFKDQIDKAKKRVVDLLRGGNISMAAAQKLQASINENVEKSADRSLKFAETYFTKGGGKEYLSMLRSYNAAEAAYARATEAQQAGGRPGAGDYMLMFSFIKNLDDSVVRESEIRGFQGTIALFDRLKVKVKGALETGQLLDQPTRDEVISLMRTAMTTQASMQRRRFDNYRNSAISEGLNPDTVTGSSRLEDFIINAPLPVSKTSGSIDPGVPEPQETDDDFSIVGD